MPAGVVGGGYGIAPTRPGVSLTLISAVPWIPAIASVRRKPARINPSTSSCRHHINRSLLLLDMLLDLMCAAAVRPASDTGAPY